MINNYKYNNYKYELDLGSLLTDLEPLQEVEDGEEDEKKKGDNPIDDISFSGVSISSSVSSSSCVNFLNQRNNGNEFPESMRQEGAHTFSRRNTSSSISEVTDRSSIIDSINWLGRHVPQCVIKQLTNEVMQTSSQANICHKGRGFFFWRKSSDDSIAQMSDMDMPHGTQYEAAFLLIDMSGFTKLSQKLTVDHFSMVRENMYLLDV